MAPYTEVHNTTRTDRQVQTATAYDCLPNVGDPKSTIDRTEVFVRRPVTQVPIHLDLALLVIQRSPTIAGKAPSYSLSSCPSKLQSSLLNPPPNFTYSIPSHTDLTYIHNGSSQGR